MAPAAPATRDDDRAVVVLLVFFLLLPRLVRLRSSDPDPYDDVRSLSVSRNRLTGWKERVIRGGLSRDTDARVMGGGGDGVLVRRPVCEGDDDG